MLSYLLQINILLNFSAGEDCPCPEEIQEELNSFHEELRLHCGKAQQFFHYYFWPYSLKQLYFRESPADFVHLRVWTVACIHAVPFAGIPIEEDEEDQDTTIKGRLLALLYKIKGPPQKTEKEPEKEQAAPSK